MNARTLILVFGAIIVATIAGWSWRMRDRAPPAMKSESGIAMSPPRGALPAKSPAAALPGAASQRSSVPAHPAADKAAQVEKIRRDYAEMVAKFTADFQAAGANFPGGLNAYLRQLALLDREKWRDLTALLSPGELEDLQMAETQAGKDVQHWLGDTAATDEQRRAVFRLRREFDERHALTLDLTPALLLAREERRQEMQRQILSQLGEALTAAWLRSEGPEYQRFLDFAAKQGLSPLAAQMLRTVKNRFVLEQLKLATRPELSPAEVKAALVELKETSLATLGQHMGSSLQLARESGVLDWLQHL
jgi:hypothetical protein